MTITNIKKVSVAFAQFEICACANRHVLSNMCTRIDMHARKHVNIYAYIGMRGYR